MNADATYLVVTTSHDDEEAARLLARSVVQARLAACAQVSGPVYSAYWWEGELAEEDEWTLSFKTTAERVDELADHLIGNHPYDSPEVIATPIVAGSAEYLEWISEETSADDLDDDDTVDDDIDDEVDEPVP